MKFFEKYESIVSQQQFRYVFLALLCIFTITLFPVNWDGNEENYFQLSYKTVEPTAFPENHAIFDASRGRILPEFLIGNLVKYLGYETSHAIVRILAIFGYAFALALLFRNFKFRVVDATLIICAFILAGQQLFGGAWLFRGGESKVFAYIFVFLSIHNCLNQKHITALVWLAAATYMHFLVGLFWTVFIFSTVFLYQKNILKLLQYAGIFTLMMSPLLALLVPELLIKTDVVADYTSDYIYTRIRNPHHTDPFQSLYVFLASWAIGIAKLIIIICFGVYCFKKDSTNWLSALTWVAGLYLILFLIISFFDRNTLFFGKFYLFRPTGLVLLFFIMLAVIQIRNSITSNTPYYFVTLFCVASALLPIAKEKVLQIKTPEPRYATAELIETVRNNTNENEIVLLDPANKWDTKAIQLVRDIPRPTLVEWKFVPTQKVDILRWRNLMNLKERLFEQGCDYANAEIKYFIIFSVQRYEPFSSCSEILYKDENLIFLQIQT